VFIKQTIATEKQYIINVWNSNQIFTLIFALLFL